LYTQKLYKDAIGKKKCVYICHVLCILYHNVLPEGQLDQNVKMYMLLCLANKIISMKNKVVLTSFMYIREIGMK